MAKRPDPRLRVIEAAMTLAAREGWRRIGLADIAREADISLVELLAVFASKRAIMRGFLRRIDEAMLRGLDAGAAEEGVRERLFDIIMRRFDALLPYREAVRAVARDATRSPLELGCAHGPAFKRSMALILEAAGVPSEGLRGRVRVAGLAVLYLAVLRVWLDDDGEDMAKTMAALDRRLKQVQSLLSTLGRRRRRDDTGDEAQANA